MIRSTRTSSCLNLMPQSRSAFVGLMLICMCPPESGFAQTKDVPWLSDVAQAPANPPREGIGKLVPLLVDDNGQPITTRESWERQRMKVRDDWRKFLGPMPEPRPAVKLEVLKSESLDGIERQLVRYEGEPGLFVEGYLLRPLTRKNETLLRPALVALHQTTNASIDEIAGVSGPDSMQIGLKLAKRGFVVFCPRCFLWQDAKDLNDAVAKHRERHPNSLGMAKMLYDAVRGIDVLESLPDVDKKRIGAVGHSLGAKEALYLAAFDDRIKAAVASEGGTGFRSTNWDAPWYLGPAIRDENFPLNHHQLLALIAPRPFLILGGESGRGAADGDRSWPLIEVALPVWKLYGEPTRIGLLNHRQGHSISPESFERIAEWLETYLK
jgi:dienelactone hydrolase